MIGVLALAFGALGAACGLAADRVAARWPDHEYDDVRRIGWRTAVVVVFGALALGAVPGSFAGSPERVLAAAVLTVMALMMATDLDQRLLPDELTLPLIALGVVTLALGGDSLTAGVPWLVVAGVAVGVPAVLFAVSIPFGEGAFGGGDVKFLVGAGLLIGPARLVAAVLAGSVLCGVVVGALVLARRLSLKDYVPFGPFLILGAASALLAAS